MFDIRLLTLIGQYDIVLRAHVAELQRVDDVINETYIDSVAPTTEGKHIEAYTKNWSGRIWIYTRKTES